MTDQNDFLSIFEELKQNSLDQIDPGEQHLTDELDHLILQHREAHFGGDFKVMVDFYEKESFGIHPEFEIERIEYLQKVEKELGQDLAKTLLSDLEKDQVTRSLEAYAHLKEVYQEGNKSTLAERLLSDLFLIEDGEGKEEIAHVLEQKEKMVGGLIRMIDSAQAFDPLFPGYGYAPYFAIICLGKMGDPKAIKPLFSLLEKEFVFDEYVVTEALHQIGESAKQFLLDMTQTRPVTKENADAAFALCAFEAESAICKNAFEQLKSEEAQTHPLFVAYLLCNLDNAEAAPLKEEVLAWANDSETPKKLQKEVLEITSKW